MIAIPAVDLRNGACVQLVGGDYAQERVRLEDPSGVAYDWELNGFRRLHVVDLDAATGRGNNDEAIRDILRKSSVPVQVGGGVRDESRIERLLDDGATMVVVGTRAIEDESWREEMASRFPGRLIVAADVRGRRIVTRGWSFETRYDVTDFAADVSGLPLAAVLVTSVDHEGLMEGTNLTLMEEVAEASAWPVIASGGIASLDDLRALEHRGVSGAVLGMALYTGNINPRRAAEEFPE
jgi:phosphoribosylformimino-5-aminoimidazole carboxamide ribotide isomerase